MRHFLVVSFSLIVFISFASFLFSNKIEPLNTIFEGPMRTLFLGSKNIEVAIADNQQEQQLGLSHIPFLPTDAGLFFVFLESDYHGIWMKEMKFSLDVIWIDENMKVIDIQKNITPDSFPTSFYPIAPARYVLEVESGFTDKFNIEIGNKFYW